ncbi:MAG: right-handed parallel beta-helix repeat-containing protein [Planctomycetales bacterium]|nr:right-handed parallel beta-helix repeat-containing protein [Planctomycetales bacterium]
MVKSLRALCASGLVACLSCFSVAAAAEFHISPAGSDDNPGTLEQPWKSLHGAQANLRRTPTSNRSEAVTVWIHEGNYELTSSWHLSEADSGTPEAPITYAAYKQDVVQIRGGRQLTQFEPLADTDPHFNKIPAAARPHITRADLRTLGLVEWGTLTRRGYDVELSPAALELFVDGQPLVVASWPNAGWAHVTQADRQHDAWRMEIGTEAAALRWAGGDDAWLHGFWAHDWADSIEPVVVANDVSATQVSIDAASVNQVKVGARVRLLNVLEELDSPGEWFLDRAEGKLYVWLPTDSTGDVYVSMLETPVSLYGVSHMRLQGLTIECARSMGIEIAGGHDVVIDRCRVRNCGTVGIHVFHGSEHQITGCQIAHTGHTALRVEGGDRATLTPANHHVSRNHIHHFGRATHGQTAGVAIEGVGIAIDHNQIHDGPHTGIHLQGNEHDVAYNEVFHVCRLTDDVGVIYLAHDPTYRGNVIRHNYLHDCGGVGRDGTVGIYLDDFASGTEVFGNVCRNTGRGIAIGGGRDNLLANNIVTDCIAGIQVDSRGLTWAADWFEDDDGAFALCLRSTEVDLDRYEEHYPGLAGVLDDEPARAKNNYIALNVVTGAHAIELHDGLSNTDVTTQANAIHNAVGHLVDPAERPSVRADSPLLAHGFEPIRWDQIGIGGRAE